MKKRGDHRIINNTLYWGMSRGAGKIYYYDQCAWCGSDHQEGGGQHKGKGLCRKCYYRSIRKGNKPYAPLSTYVESFECEDTRDDRKSKSDTFNTKKQQILALLEDRVHPKEIATRLGISIRTAYRYKSTWEYKDFPAKNRK